MTLRFFLTTFTALAMTAASLPAYAAVTNTVTAKGTAPGGPAGGVTSTATANVDMQDSAPAVAVVRSWTFAPGGDANSNGLVDAGDQIVYRYAVHNTGNVTLTDVNVNDIHDGTGAPLVFVTPVSVTTDNGTVPAGTKNDSTDAGTGDGDWDRLGPNDFITFTSQPYTVTPGDFASATSADADLDGTVTVSGTNSSGVGAPTVSGTSAAPVPLNVIPSLEVTKVASLDTNVPAGTPITYTYHVKNNGTVPINNVTLHDTHKGVLDALVPTFSSWAVVTTSTVSGNTINTLAPGDEAIFTATYTVTQSDVDTLQ
jgi:large repetitive protein